MSSASPVKARSQSSTDRLTLLAAGFLPQERFLRMLTLERKRTERSHQPFILMMLESEELITGAVTIEKVLESLDSASRETDIKGWYRGSSVIGVLFTELGGSEASSAVTTLSRKVATALGRTLTSDQLEEIRLSFHVYPENWESDGTGGSADPALYADLVAGADMKKTARLAKRIMDIAGSASALILLSPVLAALAVVIKLTSKGPVLFKQTRIGQYGRRFTFLKLRSMYETEDHRLHEEYVKRLIAGKGVDEHGAESQQVAYKLTNDPRITPFGKFLRKTSLDELPQFLNVLRGEMSLVGPRPPIPYEFKAYELWHRRRLLMVKPGITGLWQVEGRSRVKFNDMVRLDLAYASSWSLWMDLKILLRTPGAVLSGSGAY